MRVPLTCDNLLWEWCILGGKVA
eukprot:COSAG01_NODE_19183_length_1025_cov_2.531317_1_plen_22_part_01